jgi:hypothetical protein
MNTPRFTITHAYLAMHIRNVAFDDIPAQTRRLYGAWEARGEGGPSSSWEDFLCDLAISPWDGSGRTGNHLTRRPDR